MIENTIAPNGKLADFVSRVNVTVPSQVCAPAFFSPRPCTSLPYSRDRYDRHSITSWEKKSMYRVIAALFLLIASADASSAQGLSPSVWRSESGALLRVLRVDPAGTFSGVFLSSPTSPCPAVPYDLAGGVRGPRVAFRTSRTWTSDCSVTAVWSGRFVSPTIIAARWVATRGAPDGRGVKTRGTEVFQRL